MTALPYACAACERPTARSIAFLQNDRTEVTAGWCGGEKCIEEIGRREAQLIAQREPCDPVKS